MTITTCGCGCGHPAPLAKRNNRRTGQHKGSPLRFCQGHNKRLYDPLAKVERGPGCWRWKGAHNRKGYARVQRRGVHTHAHRVIYELLVGPIPKGHHLHHRCHNTSCVNPAHAQPLTPSEHRRLQLAEARS